MYIYLGMHWYGEFISRLSLVLGPLPTQEKGLDLRMWLKLYNIAAAIYKPLISARYIGPSFNTCPLPPLRIYYNIILEVLDNN